MRTVSVASAMDDAPSTVAAVTVASMRRRVIFIVTFPLFFIWLNFRTRSNGVATPGSFGCREFDEMHGRQKMLRECRDRCVGIAPEHGMHNGSVFSLYVAGFFSVAPDREPSIALALLVQHVAEPQ